MKRLYELKSKFDQGNATDDEVKELRKLISQRINEISNKAEKTADDESELTDLNQAQEDIEYHRIANLVNGVMDNKLNKTKQPQTAGGDNPEPEPEPAGDGNDPKLYSGRQTEVIGDITPDWMRRTANYFNASLCHARGDMNGREQYMKDVREAQKSITTRQQQAEFEEAKQILQRSSLSNIAKKRAMTTLSGSAGEFLLPKPFLAEIFVIIEERGVVRRTFRGIPMGNKDLDLKSIATKPVANWTDEAAAITESDATFGEGTLSTNGLKSITSWTNEFDEDEVFGVISVIQELFAESIMDKEDAAGFVGDGTSTHGGFTGVVNLSNAEVLTLPTGDTSFFDTDADDFRDLIDEVSLARRRNAVFVMHPDIISHVETLKDSQGRYIYRQPGDMNRPGTLWGYPVVLSEKMPATGDDAVSTKFVAFGDLQRMLFGTRRGITLMTSMEGTISDGAGNVSFSAMTHDGTILRITERVGINTVQGDAFAVMQTAAS